jgi:hypothetical protein
MSSGDAPNIAQLFVDAAERLRADFDYARSTTPHSGEKGLRWKGC